MAVPGNSGSAGMVLAAAQAESGDGGGGFAGGKPQGIKSQGAGVNAVANTGSGGSGACILSGGASVAGGNGGSGFIRIWEFA
jgi:hypothetical protein